MDIGPWAAAWLVKRQTTWMELLEQLVSTESHAAQPEGVAMTLLFPPAAPPGEGSGSKGTRFSDRGWRT